MVDCINCSFSELCKLKDCLLIANSYGKLSFTECIIKKGSAIQQQEQKEQQQPIPKDFVLHKKDFREFSNLIEQERLGKTVVSESSSQQNENVICPNCGEECSSGDITLCRQCHEAYVCPSCGTTTDAGIICQECWDK